ncbi:hypothetical protein [Mycolicibacterium sarraceniae]|uniref:Uncharacterized protein n=1 Tax=Mycolicibacterium sarraceniae TaxID=1534348 RepID=A0A7I7SSL6_9MYCO|nr:hypothetical protein [Mycolicibacterium sarraceniae]BBY58816.1 hypothetical protein MSAR_19520 [Mycolicibacterium sarraceniae]
MPVPGIPQIIAQNFANAIGETLGGCRHRGRHRRARDGLGGECQDGEVAKKTSASSADAAGDRTSTAPSAGGAKKAAGSGHNARATASSSSGSFSSK